MGIPFGNFRLTASLERRPFSLENVSHGGLKKSDHLHSS